jgi:hypothetical protein
MKSQEYAQPMCHHDYNFFNHSTKSFLPNFDNFVVSCYIIWSFVNKVCLHLYILLIHLSNFLIAFLTHCRFGLVEEITIEEPSIRPNPHWALITFCSPYVLTNVLNGEQRFHFIINGKDVWVQRYIEAKERHFAANGKDLFCWG